jgi:hypothetical protein
VTRLGDGRWCTHGAGGWWAEGGGALPERVAGKWRSRRLGCRCWGTAPLASGAPPAPARARPGKARPGRSSRQQPLAASTLASGQLPAPLPATQPAAGGRMRSEPRSAASSGGRPTTCAQAVPACAGKRTRLAARTKSALGLPQRPKVHVPGAAHRATHPTAPTRPPVCWATAALLSWPPRCAARASGLRRAAQLSCLLYSLRYRLPTSLATRTHAQTLSCRCRGAAGGAAG